VYVDVERHGFFRLPEEVVEPYRSRPVPWGFGALSWVTYKRSYSRDGEDWWQTCRRVVEGAFTVQRAHCRERGLAWDEDAARARAADAYGRMWRFQWTPPGRGLWIMGTPFLYERGAAALNNCGFVSTRELDRDYAAPFVWMLQMSMLGVGVGFDTRGRDRVEIRPAARSPEPHRVADSREGWAEALARLLRAYVGEGALPARWDLSAIRPRGTQLHSFGGIASGPEPLRRMLEDLESLHDARVGQKVDSELIVDVMNVVGRCVVAGGIRRSAQIAFGDARDLRFRDLKLDAEKLSSHRWVSNNSVFAEVGMDYAELARRTAVNGEPGYLWLENARSHGRMMDAPNGLDEGAMGSNPCVEQTLWDRELCCLVETYPAHHERLEDYLATLRVAYEYAKTVTLVPTHDARTNEIMQHHRRLGCSMTGIVQAINRQGYRRFMRWCDRAYSELRRLDEEWSVRLRVPHSIKITSVKPSGTVSVLAGATPGVHWEHAPCYLRRLRLSDHHPLVEMCREAGYPAEPDAYSEGTTVVSFPVRVPGVRRGKAQVTLREKVDLAAQLQRFWSDNQVSCTADFDPEREGEELPGILEAYEDRLKGIAFLPAAGHGYAQPPYETISREEYEALSARLRPMRGELSHEQELEARFCEGGVCDME
jgi:ribonucleoside-triphosphate reductase